VAVRRESVRLDVEGNFAQKVLEDAAAVEVLKRSLKDLSGTSVQTSRSQGNLGRDIDGVGKSTERTTRQVKQYGLEQAIADEKARRLRSTLRDQAKAAVDAEQGLEGLGRSIDGTATKTRRGAKDIDTYSGRLGILAAAIGSVAPAAIPLGAVGIGGIAGIANDAGAATIALGSLVLAFHGVGSTLQTVNKAALDPTAANLAAAKLAMDKLTPAARQFVNELHDMGPILKHLQASAASGWFPGLAQALHNLIPLAPVVGKIFHDVGEMGGRLAAQGAKALAGPEWASFFQFVDREAPRALAALGHVIGSVAHGLAQLWMAFAPLNHSFNDWLVRSAHSFDTWATGLSKTQGFHDFLDYLHQTGPQVAQAVSAIAEAVVQIVQAAAPLGGPTLRLITELADILAKLADSPLGTPILALIQIASVARLASTAISGLGLSFLTMGSRAAAGAGKAEAAIIEEQAVAGGGSAVGARGRFGSALRTYGPAAGLLAGQTDFAKRNGLSDTLTYAGVGSIVPGIGTAIGALVGLGKTYGDSLEGLRGFKSTAGSGDLDAMKQQLAALQAVKGKAGGAFASDPSIKAAEDQLTASIAALEKQQSRAAGASMNLARVLSSEGGAARSNTEILHKYNRAIRQNAESLAAAFDAETNWRQALKLAHKQADSNSAGIKGNSDAALANRAALSQLRDAWDNQSASVRSNLLKQVQARDAFIKTAEAMGVPTRQAQALARQLLGIPTHINPVINILAHTQGLDATLTKLAQLHDKTVNVWVRTFTPGGSPGTHGGVLNPASAALNANGSADGSTVPKDGRPYADRYLYMLAPGEEVISNRHGQADRHRSLLKAINANRAADGGTVGRHYGGGSSTVTHLIRVEVTGEMDLSRAKAQIHQVAHDVSRAVSRDEIDQQSAFDDRMGR
jgi:hypothetical protein